MLNVDINGIQGILIQAEMTRKTVLNVCMYKCALEKEEI